MENSFSILIFCYTKVYFVGPLIAPNLVFALSCIITCLQTMNLRVASGTTPAFSTNRGVHCVSVYTAGSSCAAVKFDLGLPARQATMLSTRMYGEVVKYSTYSISFVSCPK